MTNKKVQTKSQVKSYFCKLCDFIANDESELEFHYKMAHEEDSDISEEFQVVYLRKKEYEEYMKNEYERICKSGSCKIRREINIENDKSEVRRLYKEYCSTCELKKFLVDELKQNGKM